MSASTIAILGFALLALGLLVLELHARRPSATIARLDETMRFVLSTRSGRIGLFAAWAWAGIHFFA